ncbi:MAG TPA: FprA family A-type flavoprotein [Candidatus Pullilachnospira gallistercoris]|uniref:FprA family A-type flavoprotein n=1 Tax=Candidatus Pullilachnospira gallistercoris TaxID=2840911 RepID=A0A9D1J9W5_9FIRM|nr:FprA family A-type flavoprotein [Candidatus Pullilachnospira gallistercoris]
MREMFVTDDIRYAGVDDTTLDLFESQYPVPYGVSYNSYVILDEKTAIMDTVDARATEEWLKNISEILGDREPDYLVISHLEPDHAANIGRLAEMYPKMQLVGNAKTFSMLPQFFEMDLTGRTVVVKEGDELSLGSHTLKFFLAPMVHWPEVMVTYDEKDKVLFSADGFGTFGAISENLPWIQEARRYYINIVGKYGPSVQMLLKKAAGLDIAMICPLHGPVLKDDLSFYLDKYNTWSSYTPEDQGVVVAYASMHGNTKEAAVYIAEQLRAAGEKVIVFDLSRDDVSYAVEAAFRLERMVLAAPTYDGGLFPCMEDFLNHLKAKNFQNRRIALVENGSWGPMAAKKMREILDTMKNLTICETTVTIRSAMKEADKESIAKMLEELRA